MKTTSWKENEKNEIKHFSELISSVHDCWYGNKTKAGQRRIDIRLELTQRILKPAAQHRILEVGCGHGLFTERLVQLESKIFPFDLCFALIQEANKRKGNNRVVNSVASAHQLPYKNDSFDYVIGNAILHHLDVPISLREYYRVLKPGGVCLFFEPNMMNPQNAISKNVPFLKKFFQESPNETAFFRWAVKKQFEKAGFNNAAATPFDFLYPLTPPSCITFVEKVGNILEKIPILKEFAGSLILYGTKK